ncbi:hypothetical protein Hanom_Chr12g01135101 [Helianthus anomalus]
MDSCLFYCSHRNGQTILDEMVRIETLRVETARVEPVSVRNLIILSDYSFMWWWCFC